MLNKITKRSLKWTFAAFGLMAAVPLLASITSDIEHRVEKYKLLGKVYKNVTDDLRRGSPDMANLRVNARTIRLASELQYKWYPKNSGPGRGAETAAKAAIWSDQTAFRSAQDTFADRAKAFEKAVATGDIAAMRSASRQLGASCKSCHDKFREERD